MRLPNVKMLLHWPSRMHIYCSVENRTLPLYHAFVIDMVLSMGHGISAPSEAIDVCFSKSISFARRGWGFQCHKVPVGLQQNK